MDQSTLLAHKQPPMEGYLPDNAAESITKKSIPNPSPTPSPDRLLELINAIQKNTKKLNEIQANLNEIQSNTKKDSKTWDEYLKDWGLPIISIFAIPFALAFTFARGELWKSAGEELRNDAKTIANNTSGNILKNLATVLMFLKKPIDSSDNKKEALENLINYYCRAIWIDVLMDDRVQEQIYRRKFLLFPRQPNVSEFSRVVTEISREKTKDFILRKELDLVHREFLTTKLEINRDFKSKKFTSKNCNIHSEYSKCFKSYTESTENEDKKLRLDDFIHELEKIKLAFKTGISK
jgi:hypothetical protein